MRKQQLHLSSRYHPVLLGIRYVATPTGQSLLVRYGKIVGVILAMYYSCTGLHVILFNAVGTTRTSTQLTQPQQPSIHISSSEQHLVSRILGMKPSTTKASSTQTPILLKTKQCLSSVKGQRVAAAVRIPPETLRKGPSKFLSEEEYRSEAVSLVHNIRLLLGVATQLGDVSSNANSMTDVLTMTSTETKLASNITSSSSSSPDVPVSSFEGAVVMDYGCGPGRLLVGLLSANICFRKYVGVDVGITDIQWLMETYPASTNSTKLLRTQQRKRKQQQQDTEFIRVNIKNERYNKHGQTLDTDSLEIAETTVFTPQLNKMLTGTVDIMILRSVFSHMLAADIYHHLHALYPIFKAKTGIMVVSLFVNTKPSSPAETVVSQESIRRGNHIVLISKQVFENMLYETGYRILLYMAQWNMGEDVYILSTDGKYFDES
jgi:hypothetical protein